MHDAKTETRAGISAKLSASTGTNHWMQFKRLFGAHFKMTFREKQVWFWSIFYPVLLMVIFMVIFGGGGSGDFSAKVALIQPPGANSAAGSVAEGLRQIDLLQVEQDELTEEEALSRLTDKKLDAVILLPGTEGAGELRLVMHKEEQVSTTSQALASILASAVGQANQAAAGVEPAYRLQTEFIAAGDADLAYTDFLLTGMIALSISQAGMFGMVSLIEMQRNGLLKRLRMTPVNMRLFGVGGIVVRFILSVIQIVLLTLIGVFAFGASIQIHLLSFTIMFLIGTLAFAGIGYLIAALSKSIESYMGIANILSFVMMFLSGVFFDTASLPSYLKPIADFLPLTYFANGIRDGMVYGYGLLRSDFWLNIGVMAAWGVVTFLVASRLFKSKAAA